MKKQRNILSLPDRFWNGIDNVVDGELIRTRGDALIKLLSELEKAKPDAINFEKMMYIPRSEYQNLKNELNSIKISQSKSPAHAWLTEKTITELESVLNLTGAKESSVMIALDGIKVNQNLAESLREIRQENSELKKKFAELQPAP